MNNKNGILSFPGEEKFTVKAGKTASKYKNFVSDAGSYIPVDNYTPTMSEQELGQTAYNNNVPPSILNPTNSGGGSGGGGASIYHATTTTTTTAPDKILSTAPVSTTNTPASVTTKVPVTTTVGGKTTQIGSALVEGISGITKKPFPWVPVIIGAAIIVALIGAKMLFKKSPSA